MVTIYHASPITNLQVIDPQFNDEKVVFAARHLDMAYAFLGRAGRGYVMGQERSHRGIPIMTEKCCGAFEYRYRREAGAIYHIDSTNFVPGKWIEELISHSIETPIDEPTIIPDIREHLEELDRRGQIIIKRWTGRDDDQAILDHWFGFINNPRQNRQYVIGQARAFIQRMRPHLLTEFERQLNSSPPQQRGGATGFIY